MPDIILATSNATWSHPSFGLRCLLANLGELRPRAVLREYELRRPAGEIAGELLALNPRIVGLGVYIWNARRMTELALELRRRAPGLFLVLGGPEISHETEAQPIAAAADLVVCGEGETAFADACRRLLAGDPPSERRIDAPPPELLTLALPYDEYSDEDLACRFTYVETTRGCPFGCEYCLSSLDRRVREWPLEAALAAFERLLARGARRFKFVDRTFNLDPDRCVAVLDFFRARLVPGLVLHFELVPDGLAGRLRDAIRTFPPGVLRFEVGIQTFDPAVAARVGRRQDNGRAVETLRFLRQETGAIVHADLLAGLPGESGAGFAAGFERLAALEPHEIQLGILKRLRGTPLARHDAEWGVAWSPDPPYELMESRLPPRGELDRIKRFARFWELLVNHGRFAETMTRLDVTGPGVFDRFMVLSDALWARFGRAHAFTLEELVRALFDHLTGALGQPVGAVAKSLAADYLHGAERRLPRWLRETITAGH